MKENWVEIPLDKVSDEVLRSYFFDDERARKKCLEIFINFTNDWLLGKHFYSRKIGEMKYEFYYDIEICIDDIREYYADADATFYHDKEYDDWTCEYFIYNG